MTRPPRQIVVNGGVVVNESDAALRTNKRSLSIFKLLVTVAVLAAMWWSNPANAATRSYTNYGVFCLRDDTYQLSVIVGGLSWECPYYADPHTGPVCHSLRTYFCTHKALVWEPMDRPHTIHRCLVVAICVASVVAFCTSGPFPSMMGLEAVDALYQSLKDVRWPLISLPWLLYQANCLVYPAWTIMDKVVPLQRKNGNAVSVFGFFEDDDINVAISALSLIGAAVFLQSIILRYTGKSLGFQVIVAVSLGYYRALVQDPLPLFWFRDLSVDPLVASPAMITWTLLGIVASRRSLELAVGWLVANLVGAALGQYQREHMAPWKAWMDTLFGGWAM